MAAVLLVRTNILSGEAVLIDSPRSNLPEFHQVMAPKSYTLDIFELVYFAHPVSTLDGINVQECRRRMGCALGDTVLKTLGVDACGKIDAIIPVPESGYVSALALVRKAGAKQVVFASSSPAIRCRISAPPVCILSSLT
jgi:amidophosphoribosyltransferase